MRYKDAPARITVKAADDEDGGDEGEFTALVAVFGNVDAVGDRVVKGAFEKSIARWAERGDPVPIIYSHAHRDPNALLGGTTEMKETDDGLFIRGVLDLGVPAAAAVHRHMKARRLTKFSFAYDVIESEQKDDANELTELDIFEVGPTIVPANSETDLLTVKHTLDAVKAGRVLSAKNESRLRDAAQAINDVLAALSEPSDPKSPDLSAAAIRDQVTRIQTLSLSF